MAIIFSKIFKNEMTKKKHCISKVQMWPFLQRIYGPCP